MGCRGACDSVSERVRIRVALGAGSDTVALRLRGGVRFTLLAVVCVWDLDAVRGALPLGVALVEGGDAVTVPLPSFDVVSERDTVFDTPAELRPVSLHRGGDTVKIRLLGTLTVTLLAGLCVSDLDSVRNTLPLSVSLPLCVARFGCGDAVAVPLTLLKNEWELISGCETLRGHELDELSLRGRDTDWLNESAHPKNATAVPGSPPPVVIVPFKRLQP